MKAPACYQVTFECPESQREQLYAILALMPVLGTEESDDTIVAYFQWEGTAEQLLSALSEHLTAMPGIVLHYPEQYQEQDWYRRWIGTLQPIIVSDRIAVVPPEVDTALDRPITLTISHRATFGTGQHATTQLCLQLLENIVAPGQQWLDAGTGTGILAIAIARLGARGVIAVDSDPAAIAEAEENARNNGVQNIEFFCADLLSFPFPSVDGVVANLYLHLHQQLLPQYERALATGGHLICSGVLQQDQAELVALLRQHRFEPVEIRERQNWIAVWSRKQ